MSDERFRISNLGLIILFKLYSFHIAGEKHEPLSLQQIRALFRQHLPLNLISSSIDWTRRRTGIELIRRIGTKENYTFSITSDGIKYVEMELLRTGSPIAYFQQNGDESLNYVAGLASPFMTEEERKSLQSGWEPIDIDRDSEVFQAAAEAVEEAITAIEQDNQFASEMPDERAGILQTLRNGIDWLKNHNPTKRQLRDMLLSPLNWVASNFSKTVMAEIAKKAAEKLWAFLNSVT
jgi:hypothetical protein